MKLLTVGKDISELIEQIKWSGDTKQVARTIQFTIAKNKKDKDFPTVVIDEGAEIIMQDDSGKDVFGGIIFDIDKSASSKVETYLAYDLMFYTVSYTHLDVYKRQAVEQATSGWMEVNEKLVKYTGGAEVKIPSLDMDGMADYDRTNGFVQGSVNFQYETKKMTQDRGCLLYTSGKA